MKRLTDTLDRWRVSMQSKIEKHEKSLYGNGEPGMDENIRNLVKSQQEYQKALQEEKDQRQWLYRATVGAAISTMFMLIVNGFIYFAKILPVLEKLKP